MRPEPPDTPTGRVDNRPAWQRKTDGEQRWWVALAILSAIALQTLLPNRFVLHPKFVVQAIELVALVVLVVTHPERMSARSQRVRTASIALLAFLALANAASVILLVREITSGHALAANELLLGGGEIWLTNMILFALWYWEYDRGGPAERAIGGTEVPDLLFPQMSDERLARDWEPIFIDYFFVSFTNSTAFSPTDTMPLSRWCKVLFMVQSAISLVTVALIAARAVNILPGN
ncbi:MAG: hypothetical protein QOK10_987 [Pseudonocardiales bacterium]|jgi:uncharacterized membrane protein|nr:hypothetical protein [Pseudonocardiales bacterium]